MPETEASPSEEDGRKSKREWMRGYVDKGLAWGKGEALKGLGLGPKPNVVPAGDANINEEPRIVEIGWHPVGGFGGKWFAERTGVGKAITENINKCPDPTQHWGVLVGGFVHQLWMDEHLDVIYINEILKREDWRTFEVGKTRFNDEALRQAGEMTIHNMREKKPAYNLISNNCQTFAVAMLDAIQIGAHREFATTFAVYRAATGAGEIKDLFAPDHPEEQEQVDANANPNVGVGVGEDQGDGMDKPPKLQHMDTMQYAQQVMNEETKLLE